MSDLMTVLDIRNILRGKGKVFVGVDLQGNGDKHYLLTNKQALLGTLREFDQDDTVVVSRSDNGNLLIG